MLSLNRNSTLLSKTERGGLCKPLNSYRYSEIFYEHKSAVVLKDRRST